MGAQRNVITWLIGWIAAGPPTQPGPVDDRHLFQRLADRLRQERYNRLTKVRNGYLEIKPALDVLLDEARQEPTEQRLRRTRSSQVTDRPQRRWLPMRRNQAAVEGGEQGNHQHGDAINRSTARLLIAATSNALQAVSMGALVTSVQLALHTVTAAIGSTAAAAIGIGRARAQMFQRSRMQAVDLGRRTEDRLVRKMHKHSFGLAPGYYERGGQPNKDISPMHGSLTSAARSLWHLVAAGAQVLSGALLLLPVAPVAAGVLVAMSTVLAWGAQRNVSRTKALNTGEFKAVKSTQGIIAELTESRMISIMNDGSIARQSEALRESGEQAIADAFRNDEIAAGLSMRQVLTFGIATAFTLMLSGTFPAPWLGGMLQSYGALQLIIPATAAAIVNMALFPLEAVPDHMRILGLGLASMRDASRFLEHPQRPEGPRELGPVTSIEFENVSLGHRLTNVSLSVASGELLALEGDNGCGKTSLLRVLFGLDPPDSGRVLLNGHPLAEYTKESVHARIALIQQHPDFECSGTVREFLFHDVDLSGQDVEDLLSEIDEVTQIHRFLGNAATERGKSTRSNVDARGSWMDAEIPPKLSGGEREMMLLARKMVELAANKDALVMDELGRNLDPVIAIKLMPGLTTWMRARGKTLLCVLHNPSVSPYVDKIAVMERGVIEAVASHSTMMAVVAASRGGLGVAQFDSPELQPPTGLSGQELARWEAAAEDFWSAREHELVRRIDAAEEHVKRVEAFALGSSLAAGGPPLYASAQPGPSIREVAAMRQEFFDGLLLTKITADHVPPPSAENHGDGVSSAQATERRTTTSPLVL